jgi:hypothetical protein
LRIDEDTTADDITAQLLAYLLQDEIVSWEEMAPWVKHYDQRALDEGTRYDQMMTLALPFQPNALRPSLPPRAEPRGHSIPQAAKVLGITERQLRYMIDKKELLGVERRGKHIVILPEALEHLRSQVDDKGMRLGDKARREAFTEQARTAGMALAAIRQMIHRGPRTSAGARDWDALEAQLKRKAVEQGPSRGEDVQLSQDKIDRLVAYLENSLSRTKNPREYDRIQDQLLHLRRHLQGSDP